MGGKRLGVGRLLDKGPAIIGDIVAALVGLLVLAAVVALVVRVVKEEPAPSKGLETGNPARGGAAG